MPQVKYTVWENKSPARSDSLGIPVSGIRSVLEYSP